MVITKEDVHSLRMPLAYDKLPAHIICLVFGGINGKHWLTPDSDFSKGECFHLFTFTYVL